MTGGPPSARSQDRWTLGAIRHAGFQLEAHCQTPACGRFVTFDIDTLIDEFGADFALPEGGAGLTCEACGAPLAFRLAFLHPGRDDADRQ